MTGVLVGIDVAPVELCEAFVLEGPMIEIHNKQMYLSENLYNLEEKDAYDSSITGIITDYFLMSNVIIILVFHIYLSRNSTQG